jgi:hypothetical protein
LVLLALLEVPQAPLMVMVEVPFLLMQALVQVALVVVTLLMAVLVMHLVQQYLQEAQAVAAVVEKTPMVLVPLMVEQVQALYLE